MDIPLVLSVLRPGEDWGPCAQSDSDYATLAAKWRGVSPVPTKAEMLATWAAIVANAPAEKAAKEKHESKIAFRDKINKPNYEAIKLLAEMAGVPWDDFLRRLDTAIDTPASVDVEPVVTVPGVI